MHDSTLHSVKVENKHEQYQVCFLEPCGFYLLMIGNAGT